LAATIKVPTIFTATDKMSSVVRTMAKNVKSSASRMGAAFQRFDQKVSKSFSKMSGFAAASLSLGAGFLARDAILKVMNYEQAVADLSAVMNTSSENQNLLSKDAERLGSITAKSASEVVGLQEAFARLGFTTPEIINMTEGTIAGSIAMNAELSQTAELTGAMVRTFDKLSSVDAPDILDKMTLATQKSALNFEKLQTALPIVAGASNAAGVSFETTIALLGKLSDAGIDASSSSTALRNIFLDSAGQGLNYTQILEKISKESGKLTAANDEFGKRGAVSAVILAGKLAEVSDMSEELTKNFQGTAQAAADKRLATFGGTLTLLQSRYEGLLISTDSETGALKHLSAIIEFTTTHLDTILLSILSVVGAFLAMKVVSGIITAIEVATKLWTGAQWLLNAALNANPIGLIIGAIALLVGFVALAISKYDSWGASAMLMLGPLGMIVNLVMSFKRNWDLIKNAFSTGGIIAGLKMIGFTILDSVLGPLEQFMGLLSKIPGVGKVFKDFQMKIALARDGMGIDTGGAGASERVSPLTSPSVKSSTTTNENINKNNVTIDINDPGSNVGNIKNSDPMAVPISLTQTQAAF
jgi:hypothetical protein